LRIEKGFMQQLPDETYTRMPDIIPPDKSDCGCDTKITEAPEKNILK